MNRFRSAALIASVLYAAFLVSPAIATGPVTAPSAVTTVSDAGVTAVGIGVAQSQIDPLAIGQTLYISVQSTTNLAGVQSATEGMVAKLDAIKGALVKAGVPADGIRMTGFNVNPTYGPMGAPSPIVDKNQTLQPLSAVSLNGNLSADVASIKLLVAAMTAATEAGASTVNANAGKGAGPYGTVQPSAADLAKATSAAVANARTNAEALASASGRKLGAIRSISLTQPPMMGCCPPNTGWTVQVTVTFDHAQ